MTRPFRPPTDDAPGPTAEGNALTCDGTGVDGVGDAVGTGVGVAVGRGVAVGTGAGVGVGVAEDVDNVALTIGVYAE